MAKKKETRTKKIYDSEPVKNLKKFFFNSDGKKTVVEAETLRQATEIFNNNK